MSAFLKMFVIKVVSLPTYVKGAHLCAVLPGFWLGVIFQVVYCFYSMTYCNIVFSYVFNMT